MFELKKFTSDVHELRALENYNYDKTLTAIEDGPWVVAKDVAKALGHSDTKRAVRMHCKKAVENRKLPIRVPGLPANTKLIPESDMYRLILKSELKEAEPFQDWVFEEVLPALRKTGTYSMGDRAKAEKPQAIAYTELESELKEEFKVAESLGMNTNQALLSANQSITKTCGIDLMQALQIPHLVQEEQEIEFNVTNLGNRFGYSAQKMNKVLAACGLQDLHRDGKDRPYWHPTTEGKKFCIIKDIGKKKGSGTPVTQIFWKESVIDYLQDRAA